jgi:hypothetical protein
MVRCGYTPFVDLIGHFCGSPQRLAPVPQQCNPLPDVVFLDLASLLVGPGGQVLAGMVHHTRVFLS